MRRRREQRAGSDRDSHGPAPLNISSSSKGLTPRSPARVSSVMSGGRKMRLALRLPLLAVGFWLLGCSTPKPVELTWESAIVRVVDVLQFHASVVNGPHQEWQTVQAIVLSPERLKNQKMLFSVSLSSRWTVGAEYRVQIALQKDPKSADEKWLLREEPIQPPEPMSGLAPGHGSS